MNALKHSLLTLLLAPLLHYQLTATDLPPPLTLEDCILRAIEKNFSIEIQNLTKQTALEDYEAAKSIFDPTLTAKAGYSEDRDAWTPNMTRDKGNKTDMTDFSLALTQKISTGADITLSSTMRDTENYPGSSNASYNPVYDSTLALSIKQPLLRNFGPTVTKANIVRAKLGTRIAQANFKIMLLDTINSVENAYYTLAYTREQAALQRTNLQISKSLWEENKSRLEAGVGTDLEVLQAEVGIANDQNNLLLAEQNIRDAEDALHTLISRFEFNTPLGDISLGPDPEPEISFDRSYSLARAYFPEYDASQSQIEQYKIDEKTAKNKQLVDLSLGAGMGYNARENSYAHAGKRVWNNDGYNWQVDLTLTFPWGLRSEKAQYRRARAERTREELRYQKMDQDIMANVRAAVRDVTVNVESLRIARLATELSKRQYEQEKARYDAGLTIFRRVQESQRDLLSASINELQARTRLRIALSNLARLETSSLKTYNIVLDETLPR